MKLSNEYRRFFFLLFSLLFTSVFAVETPPAVPTPTTSSPVTPAPKVTSSAELAEHVSPPSYEHAFIKMILTLGGLLLLVFLTLWLLRKLTQGRIGSFGTQKKIKILEKRPLSHKTMLYLLELDGKQVFISESQLEVKSLLNLSEVELD